MKSHGRRHRGHNCYLVPISIFCFLCSELVGKLSLLFASLLLSVAACVRVSVHVCVGVTERRERSSSSHTNAHYLVGLACGARGRSEMHSSHRRHVCVRVLIPETMVREISREWLRDSREI